MEDSTNLTQPVWKKIFISPDEARLRSGWRLLLQAIITLVFLALVLGALALVNSNIRALPTWLNRLLNPMLSLIAITAAVYLGRRLLDKRTFRSLGLKFDKNTLPDILAGFLIPGLMIGLIFGLELAFGWLDYEGVVLNQDPPMAGVFDLFLNLVVFFCIGWQAELIGRGYHLDNITAGLNKFWGVLLSSLIFAALYLINPNPSIFGFLGILLAGLFLAYGYMRTQQLWLAFGLHSGWNFFIGPIFGFPVNGFGFPVSGPEIEGIMVHQPTGPQIVTGGALGPETGLILIPAILLGILLVYWFTSDRKEVETSEDDNAIDGDILSDGLAQNYSEPESVDLPEENDHVN